MVESGRDSPVARMTIRSFRIERERDLVSRESAPLISFNSIAGDVVVFRWQLQSINETRGREL